MSAPTPSIPEDAARSAADTVARLRTGLQQVLFGQETLIDLVITGLLARGHLLLEGLPGLGKTELVKGLARVLGVPMKRVQFTPDLLPGDITGNPVLQEVDGRREFVFQPGPLFASLVLADEINRASPKTQSALLEAMQERQVTVLGQSHALPDPFFVLATQNPVELEGTYPLPEAQLDRFLFKVEVPRAGVATLEQIVNQRELGLEPVTEQVIDPQGLRQLHDLVRRVYLAPAIANYIARLVDASHGDGVRFGASPRAALSMASAGRAQALMDGRVTVGFEDIRAVAVPVLNHRVMLDYRTRLEGRTSTDHVRDLLERVPQQALDLPSTLADQKASA